MAGPFEGKVALVTGSSRGIGKVIAVYLAREGADIVLSGRTEAPMADRSGWSIDEAVDEIRALGVRVIGVRADVSVDADLQSLVDATLKEFGHIDILVNNAARMGGGGPFLGGEPGLIDEFLDTNLRAPYLLAQIVGPHMAASDGGIIVNITSGGANSPQPPSRDEPGGGGDGGGGVGYGIAKAGLNRWAAGVARELKSNKIAIFNIDPGLTRTERNQLNPRPGANYDNANDPDVTAKAIAFMCKDPMAYTGRVVLARQLCDEQHL